MSVIGEKRTSDEVTALRQRTAELESGLRDAVRELKRLERRSRHRSEDDHGVGERGARREGSATDTSFGSGERHSSDAGQQQLRELKEKCRRAEEENNEMRSNFAETLRNKARTILALRVQNAASKDRAENYASRTDHLLQQAEDRGAWPSFLSNPV